MVYISCHVLVLLTRIVCNVFADPVQHAHAHSRIHNSRRNALVHRSSLRRSTSALPNVIRGVNIGSWLLVEDWMVPDVFRGTNTTNHYQFDATPGAEAKLIRHWETYFTERDVKLIASWGINAIRIPIGYWAYDNKETPYIKGADVYLERAIKWARAHGIKVLIDCHGSPGSQNGFDHSGQSGVVKWQSGNNMNRSISILQTMAKKYGAMKYADTILGLELTNEPIFWEPNNFTLTQEWTKKAFKAVKAVTENEDLMIVMHDSFRTPQAWTDVGDALNTNATITTAGFAIDTHLYQNQQAIDNDLTQDEHIAKACNWTVTDLLPAKSTLPVFVGEFSAQTNICAYECGTITPGGRDNKCYENGCRCSANTDPEWYNEPLRKATRRFLEAEMDVFERSTRGWFLWSYKGPGAWGLENLVKHGIVGAKVTDRMFPNQCGFPPNAY